MAISDTYKVIYLGQIIDLDPNEGDSVSDNATALHGAVLSNFTSQDIQELSPSTTQPTYNTYYSSDGEYNSYNQDNNYGTEYFNITAFDGTVTSHGFDSLTEYQATITYADGSSTLQPLLIAQDIVGNIWLVPPSSHAPNAVPIGTSFQKIEISHVIENSQVGMFYLRAELDNTQTAPCFTRGTLIETDRGAVLIEEIAQGDRVVTRDNGVQPIRWIGSKRLSAAILAEHEKLRPIRIRRYALGPNIPSLDLLVSPQHRVLMRSGIAQKMFGTREVLVAAKQLCQIDGIDIATDVKEVEYFHILFDRHEIVISNGAETESLYTGPEALKSIAPHAREEIFAIFPELQDRDYTPRAARVCVNGRMGRKLAIRHKQNSKALVC